jgi:hypothetical protein
MMTAATLIWGTIFGSIGLGYFFYGKKQRKIVPFICGIFLMAFTFFVTDTLLIVLIGAVLMAIPYFVRY